MGRPNTFYGLAKYDIRVNCLYAENCSYVTIISRLKVQFVCHSANVSVNINLELCTCMPEPIMLKNSPIIPSSNSHSVSNILIFFFWHAGDMSI